MVTYLWVAGLLALQGAKNHKWSPWRLFIGTALTVSAACMHYSRRIPALAGVVVYGYALIRERRWQLSTTAKPLAAIAAGGLAIGLPFLMLFLIHDSPTFWKWWAAFRVGWAVREGLFRHFSATSKAMLLLLHAWNWIVGYAG